MTTDTLAEAVLDEAEAIVCAEWMRLQHDTASREDALTGPHAEMPAARRRPQRVATLTATLRRPAITHPARRGWLARTTMAGAASVGHPTISPAAQRGR